MRSWAGGLKRLASRALLLSVALLAAAAAYSQPVLVVDIDRAMREAKAAEALRALEVDERRALRARLDALQADLEADEAALSEAKPTLEREEFERRVQAFDTRVRAVRRAAQTAADTLQERFRAAAEALRTEIEPLLDAIMAERGAAVVFDRGSALRVAPGLDVTGEVLARLDAARPAETAAALLPAAPPQALGFGSPGADPGTGRSP